MKVFANFHPISLAVYFLCVIALTAFAANPVIQAVSLLGAALFCAVLFGRAGLGANIGFYLPLFILITLTNPLFSHDGVTPLFFMNGNPVTAEAFAYGASIAAAIVAVMLWCKCLCEVMTTDKSVYLFGRMIPKTGLILAMTLRFIPTFKRRAKRIARAQSAMGMYASRGIVDRVRGALRVFTATVAWSLESAMDAADSMKARGYGRGKRSTFSIFKFGRADAVMLAATLLLTACAVFGAARGSTAFRFYPRITPLDLSAPAVAVYAAFAALAFFPFIFEVKEALVWRYFVSKT